MRFSVVTLRVPASELARGKGGINSIDAVVWVKPGGEPGALLARVPSGTVVSVENATRSSRAQELEADT